MAIPKKRPARARTVILGAPMYQRKMANVYIEPRPKGRPEGSHIDDCVVEGHTDHVSPPSRPSVKRSTGLRKMATPRMSLAFGT